MLRVTDDTLHLLSVVWSIARKPVRNAASWAPQSLPAISSPALGFESLCHALRMIELMSVSTEDQGRLTSATRKTKEQIPECRPDTPLRFTAAPFTAQGSVPSVPNAASEGL